MKNEFMSSTDLFLFSGPFNHGLKKVLAIFFMAIGLASTTLMAQCNIIVSVTSECNSNCTVDPSDDTFVVLLLAGNDPEGGTWTANDPMHSTGVFGAQNPTHIGPFPISGGPVSFQVWDTSDPSCIENIVVNPPATCSTPSPQFFNYDFCFGEVSNNGCEAVYQVNIIGIFGTEIFSNLNLNFALNAGSPGTITSVQFYDPNGALANKGVMINGTMVTGGTGITAAEIGGAQFLLTVTTPPGTCSSIDQALGGMNINGVFSLPIDFCTGYLELCATGSHRVWGSVETPTNNCSSGFGVISNANITITAGNETCNTTTGVDGTYECFLCDDGPYEVCVTDVCDVPCGVTIFDISQIIQVLNGTLRLDTRRLLAGDVNNDGLLNQADIQIIQNIILGISNDLASWCRFVPVSDFDLISPGEPGSIDPTTIDACITVPNSNLPVDFVRIMLGDLNYSCTDCDQGNVGGEDGGEKKRSTMPIEIKEISEGQLGVYLTEEIDLFGLELKLTNPGSFTNVNSELPGLVTVFKKDYTQIAWFNERGQSFKVDPATPLLILDANSSEGISLYDDNGMAINKAMESYYLTMKGNEETILNGATARNIQIPGMFSFELKGKGETFTVEMFDLTGKVQYRGEHTVESVQQLKGKLPSGTYFLRVSNEDNDLTQKVVFHN